VVIGNKKENDSFVNVRGKLKRHSGTEPQMGNLISTIGFSIDARYSRKPFHNYPLLKSVFVEMMIIPFNIIESN